MTIKELNKSKVPIIRIDPELDKFAKRDDLFRNKVEEANRTLARVGLPDDKPKISTHRTKRKPKKFKTTKNLSVVNEPKAT